MAGDATGQARTGGTEMSRVEELNQYIQELFDYWDGKNDDFEPIPIPKEVRMATDALTMASRETASAIPWETWQRVDLLKGSRLVNRFSMIF